MIKSLKTIFFLCCITFISSCSGETDGDTSQKITTQPEGISLDSILARGKIIAVTNNTPTSYFIYKGKPMGYQYELLNRFARSLNVGLEIRIIPSIPDAIDSLELKKADILASGLTILGDRKKRVDFSNPITQTHQVLIQKKPEGYASMSSKKLDHHVLRDVTQLAGKEVYVEEGSAYFDRIISLQNEIGDSIRVLTYPGSIDIDSLMSMVSSGKIKYAITEEYTAKFFQRYYPDLDIKTPVSFNQNIAWAVPKNSNALLDTINHWIADNKNKTSWAFIYNKYFKHNKNMNTKAFSGYNLENGKISPYDAIIKQNAQKIGWDWKLVAAQISVESGFQNDKESWAGAQGLMQIMPATAAYLNSHDSNMVNPQKNIELGVRLNGRLYDYWKEIIPDSIQAIKFTLASYNIGKGHVLDAQRLAKENGLNALIWDQNVAQMITRLSQKEYYRDPVVRHGYCRGFEAYNYVNKIFSLYQNYLNFESL